MTTTERADYVESTGAFDRDWLLPWDKDEINYTKFKKGVESGMITSLDIQALLDDPTADLKPDDRKYLENWALPNAKNIEAESLDTLIESKIYLESLGASLDSVIGHSQAHLITDIGLANKDGTLWSGAWDGLMNLIGGPKWVKNENQLESDFNNPDSDFYHSPAYGEAKAGNVQNLLGFNKTGLQNVPLIGWIADSMVGVIQSALFGGSNAIYQIHGDGFTKKAFLDWAEQQKGYMQFRFDDVAYESVEDLKSSANLLEKITPKKHEAYMSEFNKYVPAKGPDNSSDLKNFANTQISADQNTNTNVNYYDGSMGVHQRDMPTNILNSELRYAAGYS
jgi:hypothetical protein